jgi:protein-disulfide isomerase
VPQSQAAARAAGYVFLLSVVGLASVFYFAYASFFVLHKTCPLCVAVYLSVAGIFIVSSAIAPSKLGSLVSGVGSDISGLVSNPTAIGIGAAWLLGSIALVALFPREAIQEPAAQAAAALPVETLDQAQLDEWHKWLDAQPRVPGALPPAGVKVLVMKFNDYQCPACRMSYMAYKDIIAKYEASNPGAFRYESRDFPLEGECGLGGVHGGACEAAVAVRLAKAKGPTQGKQLEDWLFQRQEIMSRDTAKQGLAEIAQVKSFDAEYPKLLEAVRADVRLGQTLGVNGTPTFFVNGIRVGNLWRPSYFDAAIAYLLNKT